MPLDRDQLTSNTPAVTWLHVTAGVLEHFDYWPVPLSEMLCGDPVALSTMVMAAVSAPVVVGVKWP